MTLDFTLEQQKLKLALSGDYLNFDDEDARLRQEKMFQRPHGKKSKNLPKRCVSTANRAFFRPKMF